jgi:hypothetical protein
MSSISSSFPPSLRAKFKNWMKNFLYGRVAIRMPSRNTSFCFLSRKMGAIRIKMEQ